MQAFGRNVCVPLKLRKPLRRVRERLVFVVPVGDEVVPDVVGVFRVIAALLHDPVTGVPAETNQTDPSLDAQTCSFETLGGFVHARSGAYRGVDDDRGRGRIVLALDQFAGAVLFSFFAHQETAITTVLKQARLQNWDTG